MARGGPSERGEAARERLAHNPFYVLELDPECSRAEVERQGQKLLGMLELELSAASHYDTPLGRQRRTPEQVRAAMAELRDPDRRLLHELWATLAPTPLSAGGGGGEQDDEPDADLSAFGALRALGFGPRKLEGQGEGEGQA